MNKKVEIKYLSYPKEVQPRIGELRKLILKVANKYDEIDFIGEDLKWGEPSFVTKSSGSTFRLDWKKKNPESISLFFNCQTKLISTFREMYPNDFQFEGNREIRLALNKKLPVRKLSKCIELAFKYNLVKNQL